MDGLGPADAEGNYRRPSSDYLQAELPNPPDLEFRKTDQRPCLIVSHSCPWAHRAWLVYQMRGLKNSLNLIVAQADHSAGRWQLDPPWLGCDSLLELYQRCGAIHSRRATVPVLVDPMQPKILGNESAQLVEVLNRWPTATEDLDLAPPQFQEGIQNWQNLLQSSVNDGVYRCGFARNQAAYDLAETALFEALEHVEASLVRSGPWLCGEQLTLADIRLFPTLIRWEMVYAPLFGCSRRSLWQFPQLWDWRLRFYKQPGVQASCNDKAWRHDYFGALFPLNPSGIVPTGPELTTLVNSHIPHIPR
ncbi:glutathione S-transferase C-terminal domain-containing protein [Synechococcus sp. M16CYN]